MNVSIGKIVVIASHPNVAFSEAHNIHWPFLCPSLRWVCNSGSNKIGSKDLPWNNVNAAWNGIIIGSVNKFPMQWSVRAWTVLWTIWSLQMLFDKDMQPLTWNSYNLLEHAASQPQSYKVNWMLSYWLELSRPVMIVSSPGKSSWPISLNSFITDVSSVLVHGFEKTIRR